MSTILKGWLNAQSANELNQFDNFDTIMSKLFTYKLPWIFNGIAKKLRVIEMTDEADSIEELSMLIEMGLPTLKALKIYQAGVRSRISSCELSLLLEDDLLSRSIKECRDEIVQAREYFKTKVSPTSQEWVDLLFRMTTKKVQYIDNIPVFKFKDVHKQTEILIAKEINGKQYLLSPNYSFIQDVSGCDIDFGMVNKATGVFFRYDKEDEIWKMVIENPYLRIRG
jgi:hypothetical protein